MHEHIELLVRRDLLMGLDEDPDQEELVLVDGDEDEEDD